MTWDLKEPECLTQARLITAAPEFVFEQLKFYGENVGKGRGKAELEKQLLTRDDKLINLALAQFATDKAIVVELYNRASGNHTNTDYESYNKGLRVACLLNRHFDYFNWPDFDLNALMSKGLTPETAALLSNPSVLPSVLVALFKKTECFSQVNEKNWLWMIQTAANNERLNTDESTFDGPDMGLWDIHKAIFEFLESVALTTHSAHAAMSLLSALDPVHTSWPETIEPVLQRWSAVQVKSNKGEEGEGWLTHLSFKEELRCLIAALYALRSTKIKGQPTWFGSPDDPDPAFRCAFYAGCDLSEKQMKAGFERDNDVFVFAVLKNRYVLLNKTKRAIIESYLSGDFIREYQRRCEQIHRDKNYFDVRPVSDIGRDLVEIEQDVGKTDVPQLEIINAQIGTINARLKSYERWSCWIVLILIAAIYLFTKR